MSADLNTFIEMHGTIEELKAMLAAIKVFCGNRENIELVWPEISRKRNCVERLDLKKISQEELDDFLQHCRKNVHFTAGGPYGRGGVEGSGLFEAIAEAAPTAKFEGQISGFTTGEEIVLLGRLETGMLSMEYRRIADEDVDFDEEDDEEDGDNEGDDDSQSCLTEVIKYDPIKKEYIDYVEEYLTEMIRKMPLVEFKSLFGLSDENISDDEYRDWIEESYHAWSFPKMHFDDFRYNFPNAKITEKDFDKNLSTAIERFELVDYETFRKEKYGW